MVTYVALPYHVYALTHSSFKVGLLGLCELLPLLLTAFVGGALADSVDRRRMVLATEAGLGLGSAALAGCALVGVRHAWLLYAVAAAMSGLNGLQRPSIDALMPRLVERDEIPAAAALSAFRGSLGMIAIPSTCSPTRCHCWPSAPSAACPRRRARRSPPCAAWPRASATRGAARS
jgi:MFS family permease